MNNTYNDQLYYDCLVTVIGDIYTSNSSYDNKIARSRKLVELYVRRLIKQNPKYKLELGHSKTISALKNAGISEPFFWEAYNIILNDGNNSTHTQMIIMPGKDEFDAVLKALSELTAYMFFDFFKHYPFGSDLDIVSSFSIQPTFIRLSVLKQLVYHETANLIVLDKFVLAAVKCLGTDGALQLAESEKSKLSAISVPLSSENAKSAFAQLGPAGYALFLSSVNKNVFDYIIDKIEQIGPSIERINPPYKTRAEAKQFYETIGILDETTEARKEFNLLMKYLYIGWD